MTGEAPCALFTLALTVRGPDGEPQCGPCTPGPPHYDNEESHVAADNDPKTVTIIVEGAPHEWPKNSDITYAQVVTLEVPDYPAHPEITYAVTYKNGHGAKPEGVLVPTASVKVKEGMVFSVSETGQS